MRGAVNYDEDLHFSTYYLRASCEGEFGYTTIVASYDSWNETYWLLEEECRARAAAIIERALREPGWLSRLVREIEARSDALAKIFPARTSPESLARWSKEKLLGLYHRHDARTRELYAPARIPEALDRGVAHFTTFLKRHLLDKGVSPDEIDSTFATLTAPVVPSVLAQEMRDFDAIVAVARNSPVALPRAVGGVGRARMVLEPELLERLEAHRARWCFLAYHGYSRREVASVDDYIQRLLQQLEIPDRPSTAMPHGPREIAARQRDALLHQLGVEPNYAALFHVYPEIGAVKLYRRAAQLRNFYFLDMLMAEIARRLRVSESTVRCLAPEEVIAALASGSVSAALRERTHGCVFVRVDGREQVVAGERARELCAMVRASAEARRASEPGLLRGTIAQRGKVVGPVKVVFRAEDARTLAPGTIVVSEATDPDLTGILRQAAGVLTEQGGVTSHAAIICRELGVPTIIGIDGLLDVVKNGDRVELDAERGIVRLLERRTVKAIALSRGVAPIGAKAHNLELVRMLGHKVPEFVVLDYETVKCAARMADDKARRELAEDVIAALEGNGGNSFAVRSSSVVEDGAFSSAAGAFTSLLNVARDDLANALCEFVRRNDAGHRGVYAGSVIVQHMVAADHAGVCLTSDSRTGNGDAVIIELARGGNSGITGGTIRPLRLVVDRRTGDMVAEVGTCRDLSPGLVGKLVRQALSLETHFRKPLDIEWAVKDGVLFILQVRPIVWNGEANAQRSVRSG